MFKNRSGYREIRICHCRMSFVLFFFFFSNRVIIITFPKERPQLKLMG